MLVKAIWNGILRRERDDARPVTEGPNILMGSVNHQNKKSDFQRQILCLIL